MVCIKGFSGIYGARFFSGAYAVGVWPMCVLSFM
jgi:hypothetical protein